jgi:hypothetical protein
MKQPPKLRTVVLRTTPDGKKTLVNTWGQSFSFNTKEKRDWAAQEAYKRGALRVDEWDHVGGVKGRGTKKTFHMTVHTERF